MAVTMKNAVFWDMAPCRYCVNRRFRGTYRLHLQGTKIRPGGTSLSRCLQPPAHAGSSLADFCTLKMEAIRSSKTSVYKVFTRCHIPEDGILHELLGLITLGCSPVIYRNIKADIKTFKYFFCSD
jgi:hypothetical protein